MLLVRIEDGWSTTRALVANPPSFLRRAAITSRGFFCLERLGRPEMVNTLGFCCIAFLLEKTCDDDFVGTIAESVLQLLMEADVEGLTGAGRHERTAERWTCR